MYSPIDNSWYNRLIAQPYFLTKEEFAGFFSDKKKSKSQGIHVSYLRGKVQAFTLCAEICWCTTDEKTSKSIEPSLSFTWISTATFSMGCDQLAALPQCIIEGKHKTNKIWFFFKFQTNVSDLGFVSAANVCT